MIHVGCIVVKMICLSCGKFLRLTQRMGGVSHREIIGVGHFLGNIIFHQHERTGRKNPGGGAARRKFHCLQIFLPDYG